MVGPETTGRKRRDVSKLAGLKKADVIERVISRCLTDKTWRSECEKEACAYLDWKTEKARKADVIAEIKTRYDAAGAGWNGRWQG